MMVKNLSIISLTVIIIATTIWLDRLNSQIKTEAKPPLLAINHSLKQTATKTENRLMILQQLAADHHLAITIQPLNHQYYKVSGQAIDFHQLMDFIADSHQLSIEVKDLSIVAVNQRHTNIENCILLWSTQHVS